MKIEILKEQLNIKSEINYSSFLTILIGGIGVSILGISLYINSNENNLGFYSGVTISIIGVYFIYRALIIDVLEITDKNLIIKSILGNTKRIINLSDFISYNEIEKHYRTKHSNVINFDLTLFTNTSEYKISSTSYQNYKRLKKRLTSRLSRNRTSEKIWNRNNGLRIGIGATIIALIFTFLVFNIGFESYEFYDYFIVFGFLTIFIGIGIYLIIKHKKPVANNVHKK